MGRPKSKPDDLPAPEPTGLSFCPSCGGKVEPFRGGKARWCAACKHVFDEQGQGRPGDFMDRLERLEEKSAIPFVDPRVDNLDRLVQNITERMGGEKKSLSDINPDDPTQAGALASGLSMFKGMMGQFFKPRARPAPPPPSSPPPSGAA